MRVNYRIEESNAGTVMSVFDDIDLSNANLLADALFSLVDVRPSLVLDLRGLRYIDSVGLHIMLRAAQRAQRTGCRLTVVAAPPARDLAEEIGLGRLVRILPEPPSGPAEPARRAAPPSTAPTALTSNTIAQPPAAEPAAGAEGEETQPTDPPRTGS